MLTEDEVLKCVTVPNRAAVVGDALLRFVVMDKLSSRAELSGEGDLSIASTRYLCGKNHAYFMIHTDLAERFPDLEVSACSEHRLSTLFESLLEGSYRKLGMEAIRGICVRFMAWCDEHQTSLKYPAGVESIRVHVDDGKLAFRVPGASDLLYVNISEVRASTKMLGVLSAARNPPIDTPKEASFDASKRAMSWLSISQGKNFGEHLAMELSVVKWRSNKGHFYSDYYYPCCGMYNRTEPQHNDAVEVTGLCSWWSQHDLLQQAVHVGVMSESLARGGGMYTGTHVPRGRTPTWSCCGNLVGTPGCHLVDAENQAFSVESICWPDHDCCRTLCSEAVRVYCKIGSYVFPLEIQMVSSNCYSFVEHQRSSDIGRRWQGYVARRLHDVQCTFVIYAEDKSFECVHNLKDQRFNRALRKC